MMWLLLASFPGLLTIAFVSTYTNAGILQATNAGMLGTSLNDANCCHIYIHKNIQLLWITSGPRTDKPSDPPNFAMESNTYKSTKQCRYGSVVACHWQGVQFVIL